MHTFTTFLGVLTLGAICSCGSTGSGNSTSQVPGGPAGNEVAARGPFDAEAAARARITERFSSNYDVKEDENGNTRLVSNAQTAFDRRQAYTGARDFRGQRNHQQNKEYRASQWQGARDRQRQAYQGNTDANSRFNRQARVSGQTARDSQRQARNGGQQYRTDRYRTNNSRYDGRQTGQAGQSSRYVERRDGVFDNAPMLSETQSDGSEYTLDEVKRMLGTDG